MRIIGKNLGMDRLFVTNFEDKEALYKSARDKEVVRSDPPRGKYKNHDAGLADEQPSVEIPN